MPSLYIIATPIGNLEDISIRALRLLGEVDYILCEDTRVSAKLLNHYEVKTPTVSYHQHSGLNKVKQILEWLAKGKNLALVSDAGTPGISDPGGKLVQDVLERFGDEVNIESIPGPSAVTAALSISGLPADRFVFMGFAPHKKGRQKFIDKILVSEYPVLVYESKHRIIKFLQELKQAVKKANENNLLLSEEKTKKYKKQNTIPKKKFINSVVVCRELSKMHETVYRGELNDIINKITNNKDDQKGEFVVIIA